MTITSPFLKKKKKRISFVTKELTILKEKYFPCVCSDIVPYWSWTWGFLFPALFAHCKVTSAAVCHSQGYLECN